MEGSGDPDRSAAIAVSGMLGRPDAILRLWARPRRPGGRAGASESLGSRVGEWFHRTIVESGRLPLFCAFVAVLVAFLFIRLSVRMIRAQVKWWPGNVQPGGV